MKSLYMLSAIVLSVGIATATRTFDSQLTVSEMWQTCGAGNGLCVGSANIICQSTDTSCPSAANFSVCEASFWEGFNPEDTFKICKNEMNANHNCITGEAEPCLSRYDCDYVYNDVLEQFECVEGTTEIHFIQAYKPANISGTACTGEG